MSSTRCACLALVLIPACMVEVGDNDDVGKGPGEYDEIALVIASFVAADHGGEIASLGDAVELAGGELPPGFHVEDDGAVAGARGELRYGYRVRCVDAGGATVDPCEPGADRAAIDVTWAGRLAAPGYDGAVDRCGGWSLSMLQAPAAALAGDSDFIFHGVVRAPGRPERTYHLEARAAYRDVRLGDGAGMVAGRVHYAIDATPLLGDGGRARSFTVDAELVVEDGGRGRLVLDGALGYGLDTRTGAVDAP
ncbi:MAG TPA: hypothetical protein VM734_19035 [Kofleriaceae bacterium]|nr:hypothetical protein [Kofleriaceae bacterium]